MTSAWLVTAVRTGERAVHGDGVDFQEAEMVGWWPSLSSPGWPGECESQDGERRSRGKGGGRWSCPGKATCNRVIVEAEGKSHEDVNDEELADRAQDSAVERLGDGEPGAVQGLAELRRASPTPAPVPALSALALQPVPL